MATSFQQIDTLSFCQLAAYCSPRGVGTLRPKKAAVGGTPGVVSTSIGTLVAGGANLIMLAFELDPTGFSIPAGLWNVRLNVTTAATRTGTKITEIYICQVSSGCVNKATIGSITGLSIALTTTGVKSQGVNGVATSLGPGDYIEILIVVSNGSSSKTDTFNFTPNQLIDTPLVISGNTYEVDTAFDVTMDETPALQVGRARAVTLGATLSHTSGAKLDAVGRSSLAATLSCSPAALATMIGTAALGATLSCSSASALAGVIYNVTAGTMTVTFEQTSVTQRNAVAAASLGATFGETTAAWTARQGALTLPVTMGEQTASQGNVTSSASFAYHPTVSTASQANAFSATSLGATVSISTLSTLAGTTHNVGAQLAFAAGITTVQPRLDAIGRTTLAASLAETSASRANRLAGAILPVVPGLTAATALPVQAVATLASLFGFSSDGVTNLATVIEQLSLDALKAGAQLSARKPEADLSAGRGRTDLEAIKETTDLEAQKGDDSLGGEL